MKIAVDRYGVYKCAAVTGCVVSFSIPITLLVSLFNGSTDGAEYIISCCMPCW